jgi:hypothetical protein
MTALAYSVTSLHSYLARFAHKAIFIIRMGRSYVIVQSVTHAFAEGHYQLEIPRPDLILLKHFLGRVCRLRPNQISNMWSVMFWYHQFRPL